MSRWAKEHITLGVNDSGRFYEINRKTVMTPRPSAPGIDYAQRWSEIFDKKESKKDGNNKASRSSGQSNKSKR